MNTFRDFKKQMIMAILCAHVLLGGAILGTRSVYSQERPEYVPGEVLVKFRDGIKTTVERKNLIAKFDCKIIKRIRLTDLYHLSLPASLNVKQAIKLYLKNSLVEYAEPNYLRYLDQTTPNDPRFGDLWGLENVGQFVGTFDADVDAPEAWDTTTGGSGVVVAIIDSGIDMAHEDLAGNLWVNPGEIPGNGLDDDSNGYIDDVNGWDFARNDNDPSDTETSCGGHGSHTAGTVGAVGDNGIGVTGVNWDVQLMPLKIFKTYFGIFCSASSAAIISAIDYSAMMGARVSNNSYGGGPFSQSEFDAIQASKTLFVAAAGNDGSNNDSVPSYPSNYALDNVVSVAATDNNDLIASFSNYGAVSVDLSAPGVNILSTLPGNNYDFYNGTSMASPHVAGVGALLLAQDSNLTINEIKWRILNSADWKNLPVLTGGRLNADGALGFGLVLPDVTVTVTPLGSNVVSVGSAVDYNVALVNNTASSQTVDAKVFVQLPNGGTLNLQGPGIYSIPAGGTIDKDFSDTVPAGSPLGDYILFGQAETSSSFDEDPEVYQVVP